MFSMFKNAKNFKQDLNSWSLKSNVDTREMFVNTNLIDFPNWYYL